MGQYVNTVRYRKQGNQVSWAAKHSKARGSRGGVEWGGVECRITFCGVSVGVLKVILLDRDRAVSLTSQS